MKKSLLDPLFPVVGRKFSSVMLSVPYILLEKHCVFPSLSISNNFYLHIRRQPLTFHTHTQQKTDPSCIEASNICFLYLLIEFYIIYNSLITKFIVFDTYLVPFGFIVTIDVGL
jgi:hypothetical protein